MNKDIYKTCLIVDSIFIKKGWVKCFDLPIWFSYNQDREKFIIIFPVDVYGHYQIYEEWIEEGLLEIEKFEKDFDNIINNYPKYLSSPMNLVKSLNLINSDLHYHNQI